MEVLGDTVAVWWSHVYIDYSFIMEVLGDTVAVWWSHVYTD